MITRTRGEKLFLSVDLRQGVASLTKLLVMKSESISIILQAWKVLGEEEAYRFSVRRQQARCISRRGSDAANEGHE